MKKINVFIFMNSVVLYHFFGSINSVINSLLSNYFYFKEFYRLLDISFQDICYLVEISKLIFCKCFLGESLSEMNNN